MKVIASLVLSVCMLAGSEIAVAEIPSSTQFGGKTFVFDPHSYKWGAYEDGDLVADGYANGGNHWCGDIHRRCHTPQGVFRIQSKGGASCRSKKFPVGRGGAPMPYCMFFSGGYAIHGSPRLTYANVSHGCIRVSYEAANWLKDFLPVGSRVVVMRY